MGGSSSHKHDTGPRPYIIHSLYYKLFISYIIYYTYYTYFFILYMHIASLLEGNDLFRFKKRSKMIFWKYHPQKSLEKNGAMAHLNLSHISTHTDIYIYPILSYPLPCIYRYIHIIHSLYYKLFILYLYIYTYIHTYIHTVSVSTNWIHGRWAPSELALCGGRGTPGEAAESPAGPGVAVERW